MTIEKNEKDTPQYYIYPFNEDAKKLLMYLVDYGISVSGFLSTDEKNIGHSYLGKEIVKNCEYDFLYVNKGEEIPDTVPIEKVKVIDLPTNMSKNLAAYRDKAGKDNLFFTPVILNYLLKHVQASGKKFIILGKTEDVSILHHKFRILGMNVEFGISESGEEGIINECEFKNIYDLMYEEESELFVWVLYGSENVARKFVEESGIDEKIFCCTLLHKLYRDICFDPNLGFNNCYKKGNGIYKIGEDNSQIRIAVLGGSTTDSSLYIEKSWPEFLYEILKEKHADVTILNGAVSGYSVSQELIKLVRDIIPLKPHIVISFSRVNEGLLCRQNLFIHPYQQELFANIANTYKNRNRDGSFMTPYVRYGRGVENHGEHWFNQEVMMNAICEAFGITFFAIIQPAFYSKTPYFQDDYEVQEYIPKDDELNDILERIYQYTKPLTKKNKWLIDFTDIFNQYDGEIYRDRCHVNAKGNKIIANEIYKILEKNYKF